MRQSMTVPASTRSCSLLLCESWSRHVRTGVRLRISAFVTLELSRLMLWDSLAGKPGKDSSSLYFVQITLLIAITADDHIAIGEAQSRFPTKIASEERAALSIGFIYDYERLYIDDGNVTESYGPQTPRLHIFTLATVIPRRSPSPQVGSQAERALQNCCIAIGDPSTHGLFS